MSSGSQNTDERNKARTARAIACRKNAAKENDRWNAEFAKHVDPFYYTRVRLPIYCSPIASI